MFETDIQKEARRGVMLHRKDGTEYWNLQLVCSNAGCENDVDMGECICFDTKKAMERCRDEHSWTCSNKCWLEHLTDQEREKLLKDARKLNEEMEAEGEGWPFETDDELLEYYMDYLAEFYDGADFYDEYDIEECPI